MRGVIDMVLAYILLFIIGAMLYGKVPLFVLLLIGTMVGYAIGDIYIRIQKKKVERKFNDMLKTYQMYRSKD